MQLKRHDGAEGIGGAIERKSEEAHTLYVPHHVFADTFRQLRECGRGRSECHVVWIGPWSDPAVVTSVVHPTHRAQFGGFAVDDNWLTSFGFALAATRMGIRAQVHTHPDRAFHSATDDAWPVVRTRGFLSLVIPDFASGPVSLARAYLAEIGTDGRFREVKAPDRLRIGVLRPAEQCSVPV